MENLLIKKGFLLNKAAPGNFRMIEKPFYIKILSELYDREWEKSLGFVDKPEGIREAEHVARKYQDLVDVGYYPPGTQFFVARDNLEVITVMAIMPELELAEWCPNLRRDISRLRKKAAEILGVSKKELRYDTKDSENYGLLEGVLYGLDLHVLDFNKLLKNGKKYVVMPWV